MRCIADFHIHSSRSFDNKNGPSPFQIIQHSLDFGLNVIAISDHNLLTYTSRIRSFAKSLEIMLIPSSEVSTREGHLIALGIQEPISDGLLAKRSIQLLREQEAFIIAAHPFDPIYGLNELVFQLDLDALEINGSKKRPVKQNRQTREVASILNLPLVAGSDAHTLNDIGNVQNVLQRQPNSIEDLFLMIRNRETKARNG